MKTRYIVLIKVNGRWIPNGDGPMTQKQAERISREIRTHCQCPSKIIQAAFY